MTKPILYSTILRLFIKRISSPERHPTRTTFDRVSGKRNIALQSQENTLTISEWAVELPPLSIGSTERNSQKRKAELIAALKEAEKKGVFVIWSYAMSMINNKAFVVGNPETFSPIKVSVRALGFPNGATTKEIYQKAERLGLELVPAETGPRLRLSYNDQQCEEYLSIGMEPISDSFHGGPYVFGVCRSEDGTRQLKVDLTSPDSRLNPGSEFVFRKKLDFNT